MKEVGRYIWRQLIRYSIIIIAFWRNDKLRRIAPVLVEQAAVCIRLGSTAGKASLPVCLEAMTEAVNDDTLLKSINLDLLMHTRSDDVRLRTFALTCSEVLWQSHGGKLLGMSLPIFAHILPNLQLARLRGRDNDIHCRVCRR